MSILSIRKFVPDARAGVRLQAAVCALLLGGAIVWGAAFAPQASIHNAAHDGRHVVATPCH